MTNNKHAVPDSQQPSEDHKCFGADCTSTGNGNGGDLDVKDKIAFVSKLETFLRMAMSDDYSGCVAEAIVDDVIEDVECCADENYNEDDVRLAIGRVLCEKLGIER